MHYTVISKYGRWMAQVRLFEKNSKLFRPRLSYGNIPYRNKLQACDITHVWFIYRVYQNTFHIFIIYIHTHSPEKCPIIIFKNVITLPVPVTVTN